MITKTKPISARVKLAKTKYKLPEKVSKTIDNGKIVLQTIKDNISQKAETMTPYEYIGARSYLARLEMESYKY